MNPFIRYPISKPFNPLPSHEGRLRHDIPVICSCVFQSTSLSRGKTKKRAKSREDSDFQSTSLSRGKTCRFLKWFLTLIFQSTSLSRGKTFWINYNHRDIFLSIHFPLTREDCQLQSCAAGATSFNPLPSHEGRQPECRHSEPLNIFQSTSLSRGKTTTQMQE